MDVYQWVGNDFQLSSGGGLMEVSGVDAANQRIARRLLTNPGDYMFHPDYGAGLPSIVGKIKSKNELKALVISQLMLEDAVSKTNRPQVAISDIDGYGSVLIDITYIYALTGDKIKTKVTI